MRSPDMSMIPQGDSVDPGVTFQVNNAPSANQSGMFEGFSGSESANSTASLITCLETHRRQDQSYSQVPDCGFRPYSARSLSDQYCSDLPVDVQRDLQPYLVSALENRARVSVASSQIGIEGNGPYSPMSGLSTVTDPVTVQSRMPIDPRLSKSFAIPPPVMKTGVRQAISSDFPPFRERPTFAAATGHLLDVSVPPPPIPGRTAQNVASNVVTSVNSVDGFHAAQSNGYGFRGAFNPISGRGYTEAQKGEASCSNTSVHFVRSPLQDMPFSNSQYSTVTSTGSTEGNLGASVPQIGGVASSTPPTSRPAMVQPSPQSTVTPPFDWERIERMIIRAVQAATSGVSGSVSNSNASRVTYADPVVTDARSASPVSSVDSAASEVVVSSPVTHRPSVFEDAEYSERMVRDVAKLLNSRGSRRSQTTDSSSYISDSSNSSEYNSHSRGSQGNTERRHRSRGHRNSSIHHSRRLTPTNTTLTDQDIANLTRQGVSKDALLQRQQQLLNSSGAAELPVIPQSQFVVNMTSDSVPSYTGNMEDYEDFKELFLAYAQAIPVSQRLVTLKMKLDRKSRNAISGCIGKDERTFEKAMEILEQHHNKPEKMLINILISKIEEALDESCMYHDDKFTDMVSDVRRFYNRILSIDPFKLPSLDGLTSRFSRVIPDKPYNKVSNLMGKYKDGISCYTFNNVLEICEKHVEWLANQNANMRASGPRRKRYQDRSNENRTVGRSNYTYNTRNKHLHVNAAPDVENFSDHEQEEISAGSGSEVTAAQVASRSPQSSDIVSHSNKAPLQKVSNSKDANSNLARGRSPFPSQGSTRSRPQSVSSRPNSRSRSLSRPPKFTCPFCGEDGHIPWDCPKPVSGLLKCVDENRLCRVCFYPGHFAANCPIFRCCKDDTSV